MKCFEFYGGSFNAQPTDPKGENVLSAYPQKFSFEKSGPKAFSNTLKNTGIALGFIDFKSALKNKKISEVLSEVQSMHFIGNAYRGTEERARFLQIPIRAHDALIFIKDVTAVSPILR